MHYCAAQGCPLGCIPTFPTTCHFSPVHPASSYYSHVHTRRGSLHFVAPTSCTHMLHPCALHYVAPYNRRIHYRTYCSSNACNIRANNKTRPDLNVYATFLFVSQGTLRAEVICRHRQNTRTEDSSKCNKVIRTEYVSS